MVVELRLKHLFPVVDEIVVTEARETHSGKPKTELFIDRYRNTFQPYLSKVTFLVIEKFPDPDPAYLKRKGEVAWMADAQSWWRESYQRLHPAQYILDKYAGQRYVVLACDGDEVPRRSVVRDLRGPLYPRAADGLYFEMYFLYYNFRWVKPVRWYHAFAVSDQGMRGATLDERRVERPRLEIVPDAGWHLSYFMSLQDIVRKVASFAHTEYDRAEFRNLTYILDRIASGRDLYGRGGAEDCEPYPAAVHGLPEGAEELSGKGLWLVAYTDPGIRKEFKIRA
ncbi:hypothetical protein WJX81_008522 [Elliptochloris bilobata]|uniref:Uncharacterized protein n=1 Tax=Elliptochloris bilobata TaxID=381761 RepID=A0AAW1RH81_9CHLO